MYVITGGEEKACTGLRIIWESSYIKIEFKVKYNQAYDLFNEKITNY